MAGWPVTWLPWAIACLMAGLLIGCTRQHLAARREILRLQQRVASELSAHYVTERQLIQRGRELLALRKRIEGMAEIAQSSAQLAQIYDALLADLRATDDPAVKP